MAEVKSEIIKDHGDGEVEIKITAQFTIFERAYMVEHVRAEFERLMMEYAI